MARRLHARSGFKPGTVIDNGNEVYVDKVGTARAGVNIAVQREDYEEWLSGYRCMKCQHIQSEPFPEVCEMRDRTGDWQCGFRMRDDQKRYLAEVYQEHRYGPTPLEEFEEQWEQDDWTPKTQIWVPGMPLDA